MPNKIFSLPLSLPRRTFACTALITSVLGVVDAHAAQPVPGFVAPVRQTPVAAYADDIRGVYVPEHEQLRVKTEGELAGWEGEMGQESLPLYLQKNPAAGPQAGAYENTLNRLADGVGDRKAELDRIGEDPGLLAGGGRSADTALIAEGGLADGTQLAQNTRAPRGGDLSSYPSLATGGQAKVPARAGGADAFADIPMAGAEGSRSGVEVAVGGSAAPSGLDLQHGIVKLKEERISVRRALQRMLDQVGSGNWSVVWDLDEANAGLPDMEISIYAEEPFVKVLNALLARLQTRSGQPLRVIKYEKTQRLVITDRVGGADPKSASVGSGDRPDMSDVAVTETVLKEARVSLHYDEVPLVDALENIVNQAGRGQWRLRMYAGTDQVLKPAHVEEPFGVAVERILKIFNLRYEIFPGGKLIVVTGSDRFGFKGIE